MDNDQRLTAQGGSWTQESQCGVIVARIEVRTISTDERGDESVQQTSTY